MIEILLLGGCLLAAGCAHENIAPNEEAPPAGAGAPSPAPSSSSGASAVTPAKPGKGGYYLDDGPGEISLAELQAVTEPVPRVEPLHRAAMRPYTALGRSYTPMTQLGAYQARGTATWYGRRYHGKPTSTGEIYDMYAMTAAHTTLPLPSYARVTSVATGRSVVVRVNDRGPFHSDRLIDLSYAAAWKLGLTGSGSGLVDVEAILPESMQTAATTARAPDPVPAVNGTAVPLPATSGVFLQLGAFSEAAFADDFARKMRVEVPDLAQPVGVIAAGGLYRVQAGPFTDRDSARREAGRIAERLGSRPFVVDRP